MAWYAVRCIFEWRPGTYEERITLWSCGSFEDAVERAEQEAHEYVNMAALQGYVGLAQAYLVGEEQPGDGEEVFSLLRDSELSPHQYASTFFDTGQERTSS
jgi:hypothetical protein